MGKHERYEYVQRQRKRREAERRRYYGGTTRRGRKKSDGCYIATAIYGSYDCPQVWTLRRYRDNILAKTWCGRSFIRLYYSISPTLVKLFGKTQLFKKVFEPCLNQMVTKLNKNGIKNTPYKDRNY